MHLRRKDIYVRRSPNQLPWRRVGHDHSSGSSKSSPVNYYHLRTTTFLVTIYLFLSCATLLPNVTQALPRLVQNTYDSAMQHQSINQPNQKEKAQSRAQQQALLVDKSRTMHSNGNRAFIPFDSSASGLIDKLYSYDSKNGITTTTAATTTASTSKQTDTMINANHCPNGLLTFELATGYIYRPSSALETLTMMPSTLQLTDCLDYCLHNSSCLAINFEVGLCVLLTTSARHNPQNLYSSQFPVFTIYAEKKCLYSSGE